MGCENSKSVSTVTKTVKVKPASGKGRIQPMDLESKPSELKSKDTFITEDKTLTKNNSVDSLGSVGDGVIGGDSRQGSAGSKFSKHSEDSGLGEHGDDEVTYITELSDQSLVNQVENGFQEKEMDDLWVTGKAVPRRLSAKDRERQEEQRILATLQEEGLITRPQTRAGGGVMFEIVEDSENRLPMRPPPRLAKLEKRKKKKKKLTEWDIQKKLEKAEEKRKQHEKEKLERISHLDKDKTQVQTALNDYVEHQKKAAEEQLQKEDFVSDNKDKRIRELQEKIRAKEAHAAEVRRRKKLRVMTVIEDQAEYDMENPNLGNLKMAEDVPMAGTGSEQQTTEMTQ